jgi:two-component system KDP operon response regulator KdpE
MAKLQPTILVIEDDPAVKKFLRVTLSTQDYQVIEATRGEEGIRHAATTRPDLIILDLGLPDMDGVDVARRLREWSATPIIVISARGREQEKVVALDAGADDYLTKPFGVAELLARVRVVLRRLAASAQDTPQPVFELGGLRVDLSSREVSVDGKIVHLTPNEFKLLSLLIQNAGRVMTHRQLLHGVWGPSAGDENHYVRVYMNQLRQKLEPDPSRPKYFVTELGVGYRLKAEASANGPP